MPAPLTKRQQDVLSEMEQFQKKTGKICTSVYLSRQLNVDSTTIRDHLIALHQKGWLRSPAPGPIVLPVLPVLPIPPREPEDESPSIQDLSSLLKSARIEKRILPGQTQASVVIVRSSVKTWKMRVVRTGGQITGFVIRQYD